MVGTRREDIYGGIVGYDGRWKGVGEKGATKKGRFIANTIA